MSGTISIKISILDGDPVVACKHGRVQNTDTPCSRLASLFSLVSGILLQPCGQHFILAHAFRGHLTYSLQRTLKVESRLISKCLPEYRLQLAVNLRRQNSSVVS